MKKIKIALFALTAMFIFTGCGIKDTDKIVKINNTVITQKEFDQAFDTIASNNMFSQMGIDLKKDTENALSLMMREKVISELMVKALLNEETEKRKIKVTKKELEEAEKEIISKFGNKDQFEQILKLNGVSQKDFRRDLEEEIKMKKYVDSIAMVSVGESEAKKYYEDNKDKFRYPQRVRASHILIAANPEQIKAKLKEENKEINEDELNVKTEEQMRAKLEKARELERNAKNDPSSFAKIAKENSQDTASAIRGGDLGFFGREEMVEPFAAKAFEMAPNTISEVIQTPYGYHIIMVTDRAEAGVRSFEESKKDIINYLEGQDKVEILKNNIETLRKDAKIEYYNNDYSPEVIQEKIRKAAAANPALQQTFENQTQNEQ